MDITQLSRAWLDAKERETEANADRVALEQELLALVGELPEEGQRTFKAGNYSIEVKQALNVKPVDPKQFAALIDQQAVPSIILKPTLYDTAVLRLRRSTMAQDPSALEAYSSVLPLLSIAPAKTGVKIVKRTN